MRRMNALSVQAFCASRVRYGPTSGAPLTVPGAGVVAALVPIVKGAGGHISNWRGEDLTLNSDGRVIAVGDPDLWVIVERIMRRSPY